MQLHFVSFLLNLASWLIIGLMLGRAIYSLKRTKKSKMRYYFTTISSSLVGGLLAQLSNGSPDFGISLMNLLISAFAVLISIFLAYPAYAAILKTKLTHATIVTLKVIHLSLQSIRGK